MDPTFPPSQANLKISARNQTRRSYSRPPRALPHPVPPVQITEPTGPPSGAGPTTERGSGVSVTEAATWTRWSPAPRNPPSAYGTTAAEGAEAIAQCRLPPPVVSVSL
jgi:hypothetical protein